MSVIPDASIQVCHQKATKNEALEKKVLSVILNVYQSTGIEKDDDSRKTLENHWKIAKIRRFFYKKIEDGHDVHRALALAVDYSKPTKRGEYQYVSGILGVSYNPFLSTEAGAAYKSFEVTELLKFWTERIVEIDSA